MYEYAVSPSTISANPFLQSLLRQLSEQQQQSGRLYYTYIETDPDDVAEGTYQQSFTFVTTSKDIHLGLGRMRWEAQAYLVGLLEHEFKKDQEMSQMLLRLEKTILVTRTEEVMDGVVYTLSPA